MCPSRSSLSCATGDPTSRKILPAVYNLRRSGSLPAETAVIGFSRRPLSDDDFRSMMRESVTANSRVKVEDGCGTTSPRGSSTSRATSRGSRSVPRARRTTEQIDAARGTRANRLFYLATPPAAYEDIIANVGHSGLNRHGGAEGWSRIVIEKPFGHDLDLAGHLNDALVKKSSTRPRSIASTTTWARRPYAT